MLLSRTDGQYMAFLCLTDGSELLSMIGDSTVTNVHTPNVVILANKFDWMVLSSDVPRHFLLGGMRSDQLAYYCY